MVAFISVEKLTSHMLVLLKKFAVEYLSLIKLFRDIKGWFATAKYESCSTRVIS